MVLDGSDGLNYQNQKDLTIVKVGCYKKNVYKYNRIDSETN
jgi:hypothetical protein